MKGPESPASTPDVAGIQTATDDTEAWMDASFAASGGLAHDLQARRQAARDSHAASVEAARRREDEEDEEELVSVRDLRWLHRLQAGVASRGLAFVVDLLLIAVIIALFVFLTRLTLRLMGISVENCPALVRIEDFSDIIDNLCRMIRGTLTVVSLSIAPAYLLTFWLLGGQTIGMMVAGVRVVRTNGRALRPRHAFLRLVGLAGSLLALGIGLLWAIIDRNRQGWHDRLSGTTVIYWRRDVAHMETYGVYPSRSNYGAEVNGEEK